MKVLMVADDPTLLDPLERKLTDEGHRVLIARDVRACLKLTHAKKPHLVLLDSTLPSANGFAVCRMLREQSHVPIILLVDHSGSIDRLFGLELGANECIAKPVDPSDLAARIRLVLQADRRTRVGDLTIYPERQEATVSDKTVKLTVSEMRLLCILAKHPGRFCKTEELRASMSGEQSNGVQTNISELVRGLRKKLEIDPARPIYLVSIQGPYGGYTFAPQIQVQHASRLVSIEEAVG